MSDNLKKSNAAFGKEQAKSLPATRCEDCLYYDWDEEYEEYACMLSFDEDELVRVLHSSSRSCPYFRFYDEYKSVGRQN